MKQFNQTNFEHAKNCTSYYYTIFCGKNMLNFAT